MADLLGTAVVLIVTMGLAASFAVLARGGGPGGAMAVLLDFLVAAGLLRLSRAQTWTAIALAALTVVVRKVVVAGFLTRPRPPRRRTPAETR
ncbi:hypothetical protein ABZ470_05000 [Streptosporangium sp. NPDC020072]|uniref:DUF1622 domain-containing protein n=1 Tax=Streptosporangium jomthongense TaxID=1193683 RepID=A0ABV8F982_9ACTN